MVKDWVWVGMMVATGPVVVRVEDEFTAKAQRSPRDAEMGNEGKSLALFGNASKQVLKTFSPLASWR